MRTYQSGSFWTVPRRLRDPLLGAAGLLMLLLVAAFARHGGEARPISPWMALHLATVVPAVPLGAIVLFRRKGGATHRRLGYAWMALMAAAALSSFGVRSMTGGLSPIHVLSVVTLVGLPRAILTARAGNIARHRRMMLILYGALVTAGFFTLLPSRLLGHWLVG